MDCALGKNNSSQSLYVNDKVTGYKLNSNLIRKYDGHSVLREYDSYIDCLIENFPKAKINRFKFFHKGRGFWEDKQNHRIVIQ